MKIIEPLLPVSEYSIPEACYRDRTVHIPVTQTLLRHTETGGEWEREEGLWQVMWQQVRSHIQIMLLPNIQPHDLTAPTGSVETPAWFFHSQSNIFISLHGQVCVIHSSSDQCVGQNQNNDNNLSFDINGCKWGTSFTPVWIVVHLKANHLSATTHKNVFIFIVNKHTHTRFRFLLGFLSLNCFYNPIDS